MRFHDVHISEPQAKQSARAIATNLFKTHGIRGLYKGTGATMARDVTFSVIYFPLFARLDALVRILRFNSLHPPPPRPS